MTIKEFSNRIDAAIKKRDTEIKKLEKELPEAKAECAAASAAMTDAIATGNLKDYSAAKARKANADDRVELCKARLDFLSKEPTITATEYDTTVNAVCEEQTNRTLKAESEILKHIDAIMDICKKVGAEIHELDAQLQRWQFDVYRQANCRHKNKDGKYVPVYSSFKRFDNYRIVNFGNALTDNGYIKGMREAAQENGHAD